MQHFWVSFVSHTVSRLGIKSRNSIYHSNSPRATLKTDVRKFSIRQDIHPVQKTTKKVKRIRSVFFVVTYLSAHTISYSKQCIQKRIRPHRLERRVQRSDSRCELEMGSQSRNVHELLHWKFVGPFDMSWCEDVYEELCVGWCSSKRLDQHVRCDVGRKQFES